MMQLGGESKWASLSSVSSGQESMLPSVQPPSRSAEETRFKVYLATPTILAAGWRPDWLQLANGAYSGHYLGDGPPVTLVSVALPTPSALGGYNVAANASRGSETAVPAGAVYFFKCSAPPDEIATLHGRRFRDCDDSHNACQLGLGLSFLGGWDYA
jgi:CRISPR/Cas system CMR-associated protein Cmr3 (group 5 of RAMP superfamily)